jgi:hypothetical protein
MPMKSKSFGVFLSTTVSLLVFGLTEPSRALGAVASLNPTADAFVTTGTANSLVANNYGGAGALALSAAGLAKGEFQSVLRFDTSTAKSTFDGLYGAGSWSLQSVTLQLTAALPNNAIFNANSAGAFGVSWMQNDGWVEGSGNPNAPTTSGITYNSLPSFLDPTDEALGTFNYSGSSSGTFTYTLNLSSGFAADLLAGNLVGLRLSAADSGVSYFSDSRSFGTATSRPFLNITAVPEPGTAILLVIVGFLGAARGAARRRH